MKLLITGSGGFIGNSLITKLIDNKHNLVLLSRNPSKLIKIYGNTPIYYKWDALSKKPPNKECFYNVECIINLMGENVANKRWTKKQKNKIEDSRIKGTYNLMKGAKIYGNKIHTIISASAIGYYNHSQLNSIDETSPPSQNFLSQVCQKWEKSVTEINNLDNIRTVILRIGLVLDKNGGALNKIISYFSWGLGAQISNGTQWMNWIHRDDLTNLIVESIENHQYNGIYNAVAPKNVQNKLFTKILSRLLSRPALFRIPNFMLKLILGEFSQELIYAQKVKSNRLKKMGFVFNYPNISKALKNILK